MAYLLLGAGWARSEVFVRAAQRRREPSPEILEISGSESREFFGTALPTYALDDAMEDSEQELEAAEAEARAKATACLPCPECGSTAAPVKRKPPRESPEWWDDPSVYFGCADCGRYLADLPIVAPYIWEPDVPPGDAR